MYFTCSEFDTQSPLIFCFKATDNGMKGILGQPSQKCPLCISKHLLRALGSYMITISVKTTYRKAKNDKDFLVVYRAFEILS